MNNDIRYITDALKGTGVFDTAILLDPEAIVHVVDVLANTRGPNEYRVYLEMFAVHYDVSTSDLATDALAILPYYRKVVSAELVAA